MLTDKKYVGQTIQTLEERWYGHRYVSKHPERRKTHPIDAAIYKYGESAFEKTILATASSLEELDALEEHHIQLNNSLAPNGYNIHTGGLNHKCSDDTKAKIGLTKIGNKYCVGRPVSEETKAKIGAAQKLLQSLKVWTPERRLAASIRLKKMRKERYWNTRPKASQKAPEMV